MKRDYPEAAAKVPVSAGEGASGPAETESAEEGTPHPGAPAATVQRSLFGADPEPSGGARAGGSPAGRLFFPCNREDALLLLAGLCVSASFPDPGVRLAIQGNGLALVDDGLRVDEEKLLCEGRAELFPVLVEVGPEDAETARRTLEYAHIVRLVFRTRDEADAFRYRPVDEFDTQTIACAVDADCFGLEGTARFALRPGGVSEPTGTAATVDRVLAGIHCMLSLGDVEPACREAVASFLARDGKEEGGTEGVGLATVCGALTGPQPGDGRGHQSAIVGSFARAESPSPRALLDAIAGELSPGGSDPTHAGDVEVRWLETARDVTRNRVALTGDRLSDEKRVFLRGALLALVADSTEALVSFRRAEKPSGPRVTSVAAFLVGLKQGLAGMSWKAKGTRARQLSSAAGSLLRTVSGSDRRIDECVSLAESEDGKFSFVRVLIDGVQLAEWATEKQRAPDEIEAAWEADFVRLGYAVAGSGSGRYSWLVTLPGGLKVEVAHCAIGAGRFPALRWRPADDQKLKKRREIDAAFGTGGRLWYPRDDGDGRFCLCCELPVLPAWRDLGLLENALREAVGLCVAAPKPARKRKKTVASG